MSAIPQFSLFDMTGAIIRFCFYTIFTNNRVKFSWIRASVGHRESCWLIFLLRTTVGLTNPANTALSWKGMVTDGTESADSTICYVAPKSTRVIPAPVEKPKRRRLTLVIPNFYFLIPPPHTSFASVRPPPHPVFLLLTPPPEPCEMRQLPSQRLCRLLVDATHL